MNKVFISHATEDKEIIKFLIDDLLIGCLSLNVGDIFCTSIEGAKIPAGEEWRTAIKENLKSTKIAIIVVTPNFKKSEMCLNELGAIWYSELNSFPLIVEPIDYENVGVLLNVKQLEKLNSDESLDRLKDRIQSALNIDPHIIKSDRWTLKKTEFLSKLRSQLKSYPLPQTVDIIKYNELIAKNKEQHAIIDTLVSEKTLLTSLIEELKNLKDRVAVGKLLEKNNQNSITKFENLVESIKLEISGKDHLLILFLFIYFSDLELTIDEHEYGPKIEQLIAKNFISKSRTINEEKRELIEIIAFLYELETLIKDLDSKTKEELENHYNADFNFYSLDFWEKFFNLKLARFLKS